jgi:hypothetical protein
MEEVMGNQRDHAVHLLTHLGTEAAGVPDRLAAASALSDDEIATVRRALGGVDGPVSALASRMLDEWDTLTPGERIAGLLVLVEQLADHKDELP